MTITPTHYLVLAAILFCIGLAGVSIRKNAIVMFMSVELMLNAANLNLVAFNHNGVNANDGQLFALFIALVAVCEAAVGIALVLRVYHFYKTSVPDAIKDLNEKV